jgi:hypothetical protein
MHVKNNDGDNPGAQRTKQDGEDGWRRNQSLKSINSAAKIENKIKYGVFRVSGTAPRQRKGSASEKAAPAKGWGLGELSSECRTPAGMMAGSALRSIVGLA